MIGLDAGRSVTDCMLVIRVLDNGYLTSYEVFLLGG